MSALSRGRLVAFSALAFPLTAVQMPLSVYLPAIFSQSYGLPLSALGVIFLFEKLWGAAADPLIGSMSDHALAGRGRRRGWIGAGGALFGASGVLLFFPGLRRLAGLSRGRHVRILSGLVDDADSLLRLVGGAVGRL
ncbi:MAG: MFS transporter [Steroidobacteraceae bacterium]